MFKGKTKQGVDIKSLAGISKKAMESKWFLVVNRTSAKILKWLNKEDDFKLVKELSHPKGKLKNKDLGSDQPGRSFDSYSKKKRKGSHPSHTLSSESTPQDHETSLFVKKVSDTLKNFVKADKATQIAILSDPKMFGALKKTLQHDIPKSLIQGPKQISKIAKEKIQSLL